MFKFRSEILTIILLLLLSSGCTFERSNPLDPLTTVSQNAPYDVMIHGADKDFFLQGETYTLTASAREYENEQVTYQWSCDGGTFSPTNGETVVFTAGATKGDYRVVCRASDEVGLYTDVSYPIHIGMSEAGVLAIDEFWSGTHNITGDIIVPVGTTLTISNSADINIAATDSANLGGDTDRIEIIAYGDLVIGYGVIINAAVSGKDTWRGIKVSGGLSVGSLVLSDAVTGLKSVSVPSGTLEISDCSTGLELISGNGTISNSTFTNCGVGIFSRESLLTIMNTEFLCTKGVVNVEGGLSLGDFLVSGNNSFTCEEYSIVNLSLNDIFARGNWWNSTDTAVIDSMIYDDEEGANGWVDFSEYLLSQP